MTFTPLTSVAWAGVREWRKATAADRGGSTARSWDPVDLAVSDVARSIDFYTRLLGPFGFDEYGRYPSYRGTEEVVYFRFGNQHLGLRPADGGKHCYYDVGIEHIAFFVDAREEVDEDPDGIRVEVACAPGL